MLVIMRHNRLAKVAGADFLATNDQWYFDYYGDAGSGGSKLTWQAKLGMGYEFNKWTATFGYRHMSYRFYNSGDLKSLRVTGPYLGAKWYW